MALAVILFEFCYLLVFVVPGHIHKQLVSELEKVRNSENEKKTEVSNSKWIKQQLLLAICIRIHFQRTQNTI